MLGLSPDGGASRLLPRVVGLRCAADLMLTNRRVAAGEAERPGIVTRSVPDQKLDTSAETLVAELAAGPIASYSAVKRLLANSFHSGFAKQLDMETRTIASMAASATGQEGIAAFLAKRRPDFAAVAASGQ